MVSIAKDDFRFDPYAQAFADDPYPTYHHLRDEAPVYHQAPMDFWMLSRYEDVWQAHRDAATFSSAQGVTIERGGPTQLLLTTDAPYHSWAKAMMAKVFSRARMAALDGFIRAKAVALLDAAYETYGPDGEFDMVKNFSVQLPLEVISELLGIPQDMRSEIHELSNIFIARGDAVDAQRQMEGAMRLHQIYLELTQARRAAPKDDPVSLLIAIEEEDGQGVRHSMTDEEIARRFMEMGFAGHETVAKALPNGAMAFMRFPAERAKLIADLSLVQSAVQEILRYDPPSQLQGRVTTKAVTLHGVTIPADARVMLATGAAMRDERAFPDPDVFDITRQSDSRTVFFGFGVHKCLGIHLAQQEIAIAFETLMTRFPDWQVFPERATRIVMSNVRGVASLPMVLGRRVA